MQKQSGTVLLTGANGRVGTAVLRRLRGRFEHVVGFDRVASCAGTDEKMPRSDFANNEGVDMNWLAENWFWVVVGIVFIAMHLFGHGGHGRHDSSGTDASGSTKGKDQPGHRH